MCHAILKVWCERNMGRARIKRRYRESSKEPYSGEQNSEEELQSWKHSSYGGREIKFTSARDDIERKKVFLTLSS